MADSYVKTVKCRSHGEKITKTNSYTRSYKIIPSIQVAQHEQTNSAERPSVEGHKQLGVHVRNFCDQKNETPASSKKCTLVFEINNQCR